MDTQKLIKSIMEGVSKSLDIEMPKSVNESFKINCSAINDSIKKEIDKIEGAHFVTDLKSSENYSQIICDSAESLTNVIKVLSSNNIFNYNTIGKNSSKIVITQMDSNSINDSLQESKKTSFTPSMHYKGDTPRSYHKRVLLDEIRHNRIKRDPEVIAQYLIDNGVWDDTTSEKRKARDVQDILDKSEGYDKPIHGTFITDYVFTKEDDFYRGEKKNVTEAEAVQSAVQYLIDNGLKVELQKRTFSTVITIKYDGRLQYECLVKWLLWHFGFNDSLQAGGLNSKYRVAVEAAIEYGKNCCYHYNDIYPNGEEGINIYDIVDDDDDED